MFTWFHNYIQGVILRSAFSVNFAGSLMYSLCSNLPNLHGNEGKTLSYLFNLWGFCSVTGIYVPRVNSSRSVARCKKIIIEYSQLQKIKRALLPDCALLPAFPQSELQLSLTVESLKTGLHHVSYLQSPDAYPQTWEKSISHICCCIKQVCSDLEAKIACENTTEHVFKKWNC
jgi:hypothetical protein